MATAEIPKSWRRLPFRRTWLLLPIDALSVLVAVILSFELRFYTLFPVEYTKSIVVSSVGSVVIYTSFFIAFRLYSRVWRFASDKDLSAIVSANLLGCITVRVIFSFLHAILLPISVWLSATLLTLCAVAGARLILRLRADRSRRFPSEQIDGHSPRTRVLIYGAGWAGSVVSKEMVRDKSKQWHLVGFIDDDSNKHGLIMHGVPIFGDRTQIERVLSEQSVDQILIAIPSLSRPDLRDIVTTLEGHKIPIMIIPHFTRWMVHSNLFSQVRPVQVEDLLGRDPLPVDVTTVGTYLKDCTVLVTGAGGSIGSEICRQVAALKPSRLILLGRGENSIFEIQEELRVKFPTQVMCCVIADVRDRKKTERVFHTYRPDVVYHAAAHKHVPLMEDNPDEAYINNVHATMNLGDLSQKYGVKRFILISSDKAVRPTNVMGSTKRIAEMALLALADKGGPTRFITVRFGNVLGSRGSVVRIFRRQISEGGPVTVTDERMVRYFMTIPESVRLVVEAGAVGEGGEVFLLDMGEPVRIMDLAERMIRLSGFEPSIDIPIKVTGMRPGEKLFEELSREGTDRVVGVDHDRIWKLHTPSMNYQAFMEQISRLDELYHADQLDDLAAEIKQLAWWEPSLDADTKYESLPVGVIPAEA